MIQGNTKKYHIAFVDPFASTKFLVENLKAHNIIVSVIYTITNLQNTYYRFQPTLFDHVFYVDESLSSLSTIVAKLKLLNVERVYYGSEESVYLADLIAKDVCSLYANSELTALARSDKYMMQETLKQLDIYSVNQLKVNASLTKEQQKKLDQWHFPVIVKPVNSFAGIGVELCKSIEKLHEVLKSQIKINVFGKAITEFVIQEYLKGKEFFIDTFSENGTHFVSGVQRYHRILLRGKPISTYTEVVSLDNPDAIACIHYVKKVLTAVGLLNGFGHTEVMLTNLGPCLIEVNPRISGGYGLNNALFKACGYLSQVDLLVQSCLKISIDQTKKKSGRKVILYNFHEKQIGHLNHDLLRTLPSYLDAIMVKKPGTLMPYPTSLADAVAFVVLAHASHEQITKDYNQVIEWQDRDLLF